MLFGGLRYLCRDNDGMDLFPCARSDVTGFGCGKLLVNWEVKSAALGATLPFSFCEFFHFVADFLPTPLPVGKIQFSTIQHRQFLQEEQYTVRRVTHADFDA
jgi:hypothetical protein